jgi:hypothetical protein
MQVFDTTANKSERDQNDERLLDELGGHWFEPATPRLTPAYYVPTERNSAVADFPEVKPGELKPADFLGAICTRRFAALSVALFPLVAVVRREPLTRI